jgi:Bacteroidetes-specific putative membrane protein
MQKRTVLRNAAARNLAAMLFVALCHLTLSAQDKHFTQFYASPLTLNPALTGAMEGSYRVTANYRDQWRKVLDNPIRTFSAAADLRFDANKRKNSEDAIGLGIMFFNDKVSVVDFSTTQIAVSLAYHKALGIEQTQFLTVGVQGGLSQRNLTYGSLNFHDSFDGQTGYTLGSAEQLPINNFSFPTSTLASITPRSLRAKAVFLPALLCTTC